MAPPERSRTDRSRILRRWAIGLGALAVATGPGFALLLAPRPPSSPAPAISSGPRPSDAVAEATGPDEPAPVPLLTTAPPGPDTAQEAEAPNPPEAPLAEERTDTPATACRRDEAGGYNQCLYETIRTSEQALEAELARALRAIADRVDLAPVQRARWKSLLDEAQSRFLIYRNFDCQSVAPFEGRRGIGNFEARALCLISANQHRADDLRARIGVAPASAAAAPRAPEDGPQRQLGAWNHAGLPALD